MCEFSVFNLWLLLHLLCFLCIIRFLIFVLLSCLFPVTPSVLWSVLFFFLTLRQNLNMNNSLSATNNICSLNLFTIIKVKAGTFLSFHIRKLSFSLFWHPLFVLLIYPRYFYPSHFTFVLWGALILLGFSLILISILLFLIKLVNNHLSLTLSWTDTELGAVDTKRKVALSLPLRSLSGWGGGMHANPQWRKMWCVRCPGDTGREGMMFGESAKASWMLSVTVPVGLCGIEDKANGQKPKGT